MPKHSRSFLHTILENPLIFGLLFAGSVTLIVGLAQIWLPTSSIEPSSPPPPPRAILADLGHQGPWGMLRFRAIAKAGYLPNPEFSTYPFRDFWQRWHLVTVRYRTDIKELRWVYANNKAWAVLIRGGRHYPIGSRIAKIAYNAVQDRLFPDSLIPSARAVRIQMMVKVPPHTPISFAGWQYAIYSADDRSVPSNALPGTRRLASDLSAATFKRVATACAACHTYIGAPRGQVFSQPAPWFSTPQALLVYGRKSGRKPVFSAVSVSALPRAVRHNLRNLHVPLRHIHYLSMAAFSGTFVEMTPFMRGHAKTDRGSVWVLKARHSPRMSVVWSTPQQICTANSGNLPELPHNPPKTLSPVAQALFRQSVRWSRTHPITGQSQCTRLPPVTQPSS